MLFIDFFFNHISVHLIFFFQENSVDIKLPNMGLAEKLVAVTFGIAIILIVSLPRRWRRAFLCPGSFRTDCSVADEPLMFMRLSMQL